MVKTHATPKNRALLHRTASRRRQWKAPASPTSARSTTGHDPSKIALARSNPIAMPSAGRVTWNHTVCDRNDLGAAIRKGRLMASTASAVPAASHRSDAPQPALRRDDRTSAASAPFGHSRQAGAHSNAQALTLTPSPRQSPAARERRAPCSTGRDSQVFASSRQERLSSGSRYVLRS